MIKSSPFFQLEKINTVESNLSSNLGSTVRWFHNLIQQVDIISNSERICVVSYMDNENSNMVKFNRSMFELSIPTKFYQCE
jgi:hypothetical protein